MWGPARGLLKSRSVVDVVLVEVSNVNEPLSEETVGLVAHAAKQRLGVRLILWGSPEVMASLEAGQLAKLTEGGSCLTGYKMKKMTVYLPKEEPLGARSAGALNVERLVILLSPSPMRSCLTYMVSHIGWCPALVAHLVWCLDVARVSLKTGVHGGNCPLGQQSVLRISCTVMGDSRAPGHGGPASYPTWFLFFLNDFTPHGFLHTCHK